MNEPTRLPALDKERSTRLWEEWGKQPKRFLKPKKSAARKEPPAVSVVRATRSKKVRRK